MRYSHVSKWASGSLSYTFPLNTDHSVLALTGTLPDLLILTHERTLKLLVYEKKRPMAKTILKP